jgi:transposase-like protein
MTAEFPKTLAECVEQFSDPNRAHEFATRMRWPKGVECPRCGSKNLREIKTRRLWVCKNCTGHNQFSVKVGSIFEDSPLSLGKWLTAIWLLLNAKNGISSYEVHRALGITQKSAWFMLHRIRTAVQTGTFQKLHGTVEVDETFIGGASKNMFRFDGSTEKRREMPKSGCFSR